MMPGACGGAVGVPSLEVGHGIHRGGDSQRERLEGGEGQEVGTPGGKTAWREGS